MEKIDFCIHILFFHILSALTRSRQCNAAEFLVLGIWRLYNCLFHWTTLKLDRYRIQFKYFLFISQSIYVFILLMVHICDGTISYVPTSRNFNVKNRRPTYTTRWNDRESFSCWFHKLPYSCTIFYSST